MELKRMSEYERTGKLQRKIDVYVQSSTSRDWMYLHSTNWHKRLVDAIEAAKLKHGAHHNFRACFADAKPINRSKPRR